MIGLMRFPISQLHNARGSQDEPFAARPVEVSDRDCLRNATATTDVIVKALLCSSASSDALQSLYSAEAYNEYLCEAGICISASCSCGPWGSVVLLDDVWNWPASPCNAVHCLGRGRFRCKLNVYLDPCRRGTLLTPPLSACLEAEGCLVEQSSLVPKTVEKEVFTCHESVKHCFQQACESRC